MTRHQAVAIESFTQPFKLGSRGLFVVFPGKLPPVCREALACTCTCHLYETFVSELLAAVNSNGTSLVTCKIL
jgi:hypothetical protein